MVANSSEAYSFENQAASGAAVVEFSEFEDPDAGSSFSTLRLPWECEEEVPPTTAPPVVSTPHAPLMPPTEVVTPVAPLSRTTSVRGAIITSQASELPRTGSSNTVLGVVAIALIGAGICLTESAKHRQLRQN
ncbi:LPXTG cell wall anchor domain-containing protein [Candidatus Saccharibacteria bacterium]|nr:LPXTG cell wall anchor domain-containing protein [Candidatus Saccharibacteria bacterium]